MQNFFTREDVLAYHQQGVQTIRLDSMPILTDLAGRPCRPWAWRS